MARSRKKTYACAVKYKASELRKERNRSRKLICRKSKRNVKDLMWDPDTPLRRNIL